LILSLLEQVVKLQKRRWLDNHSGSPKATLVEKQRPEPEQESIQCAESGPSSPGAIDDQQLLLHEQALSDDGPRVTGPQQFGDCGQ
jgi:hypothetical protein